MKASRAGFFCIVLTACLIIGGILEVGNCENILVLAPLSPKSHKHVLEGIYSSLGQRGHNITVLTAWTSLKAPENVTEVIVLESGFDCLPNINTFELRGMGTLKWILTINFNHFSGACTETLRHPRITSEILAQKFDLILVDLFTTECIFGLIQKVGAPFIWVSSQPSDFYRMNIMGNRQPPSFVPDTLSGYTDRMSFQDRVGNYFYRLGFYLGIIVRYHSEWERVYREHLGEDLPGIDEISKNVSLVLGNTHFTLNFPRPNLPDFVEIGGAHCRAGKPLPKDIEDFVKDSSGFILFSLGTIVKPNEIPPDILKVFTRVFSKLKYKVLWKWPEDTLPDLPVNVKLLKWLPQQDVLVKNDIVEPTNK